MTMRNDPAPRAPRTDGNCPRCGRLLPYGTRRCPDCGAMSLYWPEPGCGYCGNCHEELQEGDLFCRVCGTPVGQGAFQPFENVSYCVYGPPPIKREHICPKCGFRWETYQMIDRDSYCPRCGSEADCIEHDHRFEPHFGLEPTQDLSIPPEGGDWGKKLGTIDEGDMWGDENF